VISAPAGARAEDGRGMSRSLERQLREKAHSEEPQVVPGSGRRVAPRSIAQMISVRLEARLVSELRSLADEMGVSLSELLRRGAEMVLADARSNPSRLTWEVQSPAKFPTGRAIIKGGVGLTIFGTGPTLSGSK